MTTQHLHMQFPTSRMAEHDYEAVLAHLSEQIGGRMDAPDRSEAEKTACDALSNTFDGGEGVTIADWLCAAAKRCHVNPADCAGI